ncbi:hypothetical protein H311_00243 [Anncaliia algerae PRA109]|nr:hypothetical protein H311_00243 [Anncaliia algerae PRA109]
MIVVLAIFTKKLLLKDNYYKLHFILFMDEIKNLGIFVKNILLKKYLKYLIKKSLNFFSLSIFLFKSCIIVYLYVLIINLFYDYKKIGKLSTFIFRNIIIGYCLKKINTLHMKKYTRIYIR